MPTSAQWAEIERVTANLDPATAHAMRTLFVITEHENIPEANDLIIAALQEKGKVPEKAVKTLAGYKLVDTDGTISKALKTAIQDAVKTHHLEIKGLPTPQLKIILSNLLGWGTLDLDLNFCAARA